MQGEQAERKEWHRRLAGGKEVVGRSESALYVFGEE